MELTLRRKKRRELAVGDACKLKKAEYNNFVHGENNKVSSNHYKSNEIPLGRISTFVVVESPFGLNDEIVAVMPITTKNYDWHGRKLIKFLKTRKCFHVKRAHLSFANKDQLKDLKHSHSSKAMEVFNELFEIHSVKI